MYPSFSNVTSTLYQIADQLLAQHSRTALLLVPLFSDCCGSMFCCTAQPNTIYRTIALTFLKLLPPGTLWQYLKMTHWVFRQKRVKMQPTLTKRILQILLLVMRIIKKQIKSSPVPLREAFKQPQWNLCNYPATFTHAITLLHFQLCQIRSANFVQLVTKKEIFDQLILHSRIFQISFLLRHHMKKKNLIKCHWKKMKCEK